MSRKTKPLPSPLTEKFIAEREAREAAAQIEADAKRIYLAETNRDDWRDRATTAEALVQSMREALANIRELNFSGADENGNQWANSDLIDQEITAALSRSEVPTYGGYCGAAGRPDDRKGNGGGP